MKARTTIMYGMTCSNMTGDGSGSAWTESLKMKKALQAAKEREIYDTAMLTICIVDHRPVHRMMCSWVSSCGPDSCNINVALTLLRKYN